MATLTNLTIAVHPEDVGFFYKLLADYHSSRIDFKQSYENFLQGNDETQRKEYKILPELSQGAVNEQSLAVKESFYSSVIKLCSCGNCFNTFARPSRTPWIPRGNGQFSNAEHGTVVIKGCPVSTLNVPGYIHRTFTDFEKAAKITKLRSTVEQEAMKVTKARIDHQVDLKSKELDIQEKREKLVASQRQQLEKLQKRIHTLEMQRVKGAQKAKDAFEKEHAARVKRQASKHAYAIGALKDLENGMDADILDQEDWQRINSYKQSLSVLNNSTIDTPEQRELNQIDSQLRDMRAEKQSLELDIQEKLSSSRKAEDNGSSLIKNTGRMITNASSVVKPKSKGRQRK